MRTPSHVVSAAALAAILGVYEAFVAVDVELSRGTLVVLGFALVGVGGVLLGLVQAAAWRGAARVCEITGLAEFWRAATSRDRGAPRDSAILLHGAAVGLLVLVFVLAVAAWIVLPRLLHMDDEDLARSFGLLIIVCVAAAGVLSATIATRVSLPIVERIDRRVPLPWPSPPVARYLLWFAAPLLAALVPYLRRNEEGLGVFALPFWLLAFLVFEGLVVLGWREVVVRVALPWRAIRRAFLGVLAASFLASLLLLRDSPAAVEWTRSGGAVTTATNLLRKIADFDRDGYSTWLGGGDCAPFDAAINPGARDVPDNAVDENCDGDDATTQVQEALAVASNALPAKQVRKYNIVLVIVDAMRFDHTGLSGYKKKTTPYLDALGAEALVFTRAYAQSSATMLSVPSILTGRDPSAMNWHKSARLEPDEKETALATLLKGHGYETGIVCVKYFAEILERVRTDYEYDRILHKHKGEKSDWHTGRAGPIVVDGIRYIEKHASAKQPFFLTLFIPEPHSTYDKHAFGISSFGKGKAALYDGEIANADRHIGFLIEYLKYSKRWDDTIFIVTSDHGEEFREHGGTQHARTCYAESTHVPLVVHVPGVEPQRIDDPVGLVDIVPTVLEAVGATDGMDELSGQSLLIPALSPSLMPADRMVPCTVISQRAKQGNFFRRALRTRDWLLVHEHLADDYELYDTNADPAEGTNVYDRHAEDPAIAQIRASLNARLTGNLAENLLTD